MTPTILSKIAETDAARTDEAQCRVSKGQTVEVNYGPVPFRAVVLDVYRHGQAGWCVTVQDPAGKEISVVQARVKGVKPDAPSRADRRGVSGGVPGGVPEHGRVGVDSGVKK